MIENSITLRELRSDDRAEIARILESISAFRPEEVAIALELVDETLNPTPSTDYEWIIADHGGRVVGFACFGPVPLTEGTFDLYWIAVIPEAARLGVGTRLDDAATTQVQARPGVRWLLAETSSTGDYAPARAFYLQQGYQMVGRLLDYYRPGDDRLTFGKRLDEGSPHVSD